MKHKVINILHHPPAYDAYRNSPRPDINWDTSNGEWVGIWGYDWPNLIGNEVLNITNEFDYEVWQPDLRADKMYEHRFNNGQVHKLFPAKEITRRYGLKKYPEIISEELLRQLKQENHAIIHMNKAVKYLNYLILKKTSFPVVIQYHTRPHIPKVYKKTIRKNILGNWYNHKIDRLLHKKKLAFIYNNSHKSEVLKKYRAKKVERIFMGADFNHWKPGNNKEAKSKLGLESSAKVVLLVSRFIEAKQIDRFIDVLNNLGEQYDFRAILVGHGESDYESYIKKKATSLNAQGKIIFPGYVKGNELMKYYHASDLFVSVSKAEGGPVSVIKALACEIPVLCTKVGGVDEILDKHQAGVLVNPSDYDQWRNELINFFRGKSIPAMDRKRAAHYFHWPNIAKQFVKIYAALKD